MISAQCQQRWFADAFLENESFTISDRNLDGSYNRKLYRKEFGGGGKASHVVHKRQCPSCVDVDDTKTSPIVVKWKDQCIADRAAKFTKIDECCTIKIVQSDQLEIPWTSALDITMVLDSSSFDVGRRKSNMNAVSIFIDRKRRRVPFDIFTNRI